LDLLAVFRRRNDRQRRRQDLDIQAADPRFDGLGYLPQADDCCFVIALGHGGGVRELWPKTKGPERYADAAIARGAGIELRWLAPYPDFGSLERGRCRQ
jgi:hypothetical protein